MKNLSSLTTMMLFIKDTDDILLWRFLNALCILIQYFCGLTLTETQLRVPQGLS